jgi:hypothetical protein
MRSGGWNQRSISSLSNVVEKAGDSNTAGGYIQELIKDKYAKPTQNDNSYYLCLRMI